MKKINTLLLTAILLTLTHCSHAPVRTDSKPVAASAAASADNEAKTDVISELKMGNARFVKHQSIHPRQNAARIAEMSSGQKPGAVVISCSDSRVPPEVIFDQGLGDIFSIRTAGQAMEAYAVGSAEYAVEHLGSKVIVVMGHSSCGAVKAAATTPEGKSTGSRNIDQLLHKIRPGLKKYDAKDKELIQASKNNVEAAAEYLKFKSPLIREELAHHKLILIHALYHLPTGEVEFW